MSYDGKIDSLTGTKWVGGALAINEYIRCPFCENDVATLEIDENIDGHLCIRANCESCPEHTKWLPLAEADKTTADDK